MNLVEEFLDGINVNRKQQQNLLRLHKNLKDDEYPLISSSVIRCIAKAIHVDMQHGPWIAGGNVRKNYYGMEHGESDWDFFFHDECQFNIAINICKNLGLPDIYTSEHAITFKYEFTVIQLIRNKFHNTPEDVLNYFDFSVCQYLTDGYSYKLGEHTLVDHEEKRLRYLPESIRGGIIARILKYRVYGFYVDNDLSNKIQSMYNLIDFQKEGLEYEF